jgi:hypothetical protein
MALLDKDYLLSLGQIDTELKTVGAQITLSSLANNTTHLVPQRC